MGRTGNLREYLSDISRTISSSGSGGGESKDVFDAFKSYVTNTNNIDSITLVDQGSAIENIAFANIVDNTIEEPTFDGLSSVTIHYKNGKNLQITTSSDRFGVIVISSNGSWVIRLVNGGELGQYHLACADSDLLWSITIIVPPVEVPCK